MSQTRREIIQTECGLSLFCFVKEMKSEYFRGIHNMYASEVASSTEWRETDATKARSAIKDCSSKV